MALLVTTITDSGLTLQNTYARIGSIMGNKDGVTVVLSRYVSIDAFNQGKEAVEHSSHLFVPSVDDGADNFIKQGYEYLKEQPEFAGAVDC